MTTTRLLPGVLLSVFLSAASAETILVKTTVDLDATAPPPPDSLREAVRRAQPGDIIKFQGTLAIELQNELLLGAGVTIEGPAQIRARVNSDGSVAFIQTTAPGVTLRNLNFRDVPVRVGDRALLGLVGFTMTDCTFTLAGALQLINVFDGVVESNHFEVANDGTEGAGSLSLSGTRNCKVRNNTFNVGPKAGGIVCLHDQDLLLENNTLNTGFSLQPDSATIRKNKLFKSGLFLDTATSEHPGAVLVEENECGVLHAQGLNMTLRKNKMSGKLGRIPTTTATFTCAILKGARPR